MNENILDEKLHEKPNSRRRDLLPTWIKVFIWIFLIFGAVVPVALIFGIIGMNFNLSLYGLETFQPISLIGIFIIVLFAIKGIVAFGLWTEKEWAVNIAIIDAILGILVCIFVMAILPFMIENKEISISLRLEILFLIPYLIKMKRIQSAWMESTPLKPNSDY